MGTFFTQLEFSSSGIILFPLFSIGVFLGTTLLTLPIRIKKAKRETRVEASFEFQTLWDISVHVEKWITKKTIGILWMLFTLESFLLLNGLILLYWVGLI